MVLPARRAALTGARGRRRYPVLADAAIAAGLDTAAAVGGIAAGNAYFACCLLAHRFDHGFLRYGEYLARLGDLLAVLSDATAVRRVSLSLL